MAASPKTLDVESPPAPAEALAAAEREVTALQLERDALPDRLRAAAEAGDAGAVLRLRRRSDDLPVELWAAELAVLRAREAVLAEQVAGITDAEVQALQVEAAAAEEHLRAAQEAAQAARWALADRLQERRIVAADLTKVQGQLAATDSCMDS